MHGRACVSETVPVSVCCMREQVRIHPYICSRRPRFARSSCARAHVCRISLHAAACARQEDTLHLFITRHPYEWIDSMRRNAFFARSSLRGPSIQPPVSADRVYPRTQPCFCSPCIIKHRIKSFRIAR